MTWSSVNVFYLFRYNYVLFCCTRRVSSNTCLCSYLIKHTAEMQWKIFSEKVVKKKTQRVNANVWECRIRPTVDSITNIRADCLRIIAVLRPSFCFYFNIFFNHGLIKKYFTTDGRQRGEECTHMRINRHKGKK